MISIEGINDVESFEEFKREVEAESGKKIKATITHTVGNDFLVVFELPKSEAAKGWRRISYDENKSFFFGLLHKVKEVFDPEDIIVDETLSEQERLQWESF